MLIFFGREGVQEGIQPIHEEGRRRQKASAVRVPESDPPTKEVVVHEAELGRPSHRGRLPKAKKDDNSKNKDAHRTSEVLKEPVS
jgi:hypothetical protein